MLPVINDKFTADVMDIGELLAFIKEHEEKQELCKNVSTVPVKLNRRKSDKKYAS